MHHISQPFANTGLVTLVLHKTMFHDTSVNSFHAELVAVWKTCSIISESYLAWIILDSFFDCHSYVFNYCTYLLLFTKLSIFMQSHSACILWHCTVVFTHTLYHNTMYITLCMTPN